MSSAVVSNPRHNPTINQSGVVANFLSTHQPTRAGTPIIHGIASASPTVVVA